MNSNYILFLNGTSSAGKTSIVRELKKLIQRPVLDFSVDNLFCLFPKALMKDDPFIHCGPTPMIKDPSNHQLPEKEFQQLMELFPKYISGFHRSIGAFYEAGNDLIVDHVLQEEEWYKECINICQGKRAYFIGVECPLDIINQRERQRGDRPIGMAEHQYSKIHGEGIYDVKVDTSILSPEECAKKIYAYIEENAEPEAFNKLSKLINKENS